MKPALRWTLAIVGLLAVNLVAMVLLAVYANASAPEIIPSYLERDAR
jgi:hypothetical protein